MLAMVMLTGCTFGGGRDGRDGADGRDAEFKVTEFTVSKWNYTNIANNNYFFARYDVPALTSYVANKGNCSCYLIQKDPATGNGTAQTPLPMVIHCEQQINGNWVQFTETYSFVYGIGWVEVQMRASDFDYEINQSLAPPVTSFRFVMTY